MGHTIYIRVFERDGKSGAFLRVNHLNGFVGRMVHDPEIRSVFLTFPNSEED